MKKLMVLLSIILLASQVSAQEAKPDGAQAKANSRKDAARKKANRQPAPEPAKIVNPAGLSRTKRIKCPSCPRDSRGKIKHGESANARFKRMTGYPNGRKGYTVDHVVPLSRGGLDDPSNMQWLTKSQAKAKKKQEHRWH